MTTVNRLSTLITSLSSTDHPVMQVNDEVICGERFSDSVAANYQRLNQTDAAVVAIHTVCAYQFSIALFAALHAQKNIVILPHLQSGFIEKVACEIDLLMTDDAGFDSLPTFVIKQVTNNAIDLTAARELALSDLNHNASLSFFTSGSTGFPTRIYKTLHQIANEIDVLTLVWGGADATGTFYTTVSHQHFYGFIFRLLWPLTVGCLIDAKQYHYPEPLVAALQKAKNTVLIASPAMLNRIGQLVDLSTLRGAFKYIFSAGGPLNCQAALDISALTQNPVQEIFGSTETGAVAHRNQQADTQEVTPWTLLPTVTMKLAPENHCLMINSSYVDGNDWFEMGDTADRVNHKQFILKHRVDKIVKIEEKRLSLPEMEAALLSHPLVESCACATSGSNRLIVVAVVSLSQEGRSLLVNKSKRSLNQILRSHLSQFFETILIPKKWRYVDALPLNSQGKVTTAAIEALFLPPESLPTEPLVTVVEKHDDNTVLILTISKQLRYFDGHFDSKPILPGVVQVDWAAKYAQKFFPIDGVFQRLEVIKFHEFIVPDSTVELSISYQQNNGRIVFRYSSTKGVHSSGRIVFG